MDLGRCRPSEAHYSPFIRYKRPVTNQDRVLFVENTGTSAQLRDASKLRGRYTFSTHLALSDSSVLLAVVSASSVDWLPVPVPDSEGARSCGGRRAPYRANSLVNVFGGRKSVKHPSHEQVRAVRLPHEAAPTAAVAMHP